MSARLDGKVVAVTGAGSGLGAAFAVALAREGARIGVLDLDAGRAEHTVRAVSDAGGQAVAYAVDVSERDEVRAALKGVTDRFGRLDVMFNNAGITLSTPFLEATESDFRKLHDVNVIGVLVGTQEAARIFIGQGGGGKIINTCSIASRQARPNFAAYAASKFAVHSLVQSGARALAEHGITVNGFAPGIVDTAVWEAASGGDTGRRQEMFEEYATRIPVGRVAQPQDLAPTAVFLAASDSDYITGQVVMTDGGMEMV